MNIGLIGRGHVGAAVERLFSPHHTVTSWDASDGHPAPLEALSDCAVVVVCVSTPSGPDGVLDASAVHNAVAQIPGERILLKSTVPPGTVDELVALHTRDICYWPEYVGQSSYHNPHFPSEIADVPFVVLGGSPHITNWCLELLQPILGPTKTYFRCSARDAEMIKLTENAYFAAKVTFVNEISRICEALDADWHTVREGWLLDPRVERMHTLAFRDAPGFDGKCLPKDLAGLLAVSRRNGYDPAFLNQVLASNDSFRTGRPPD